MMIKICIIGASGRMGRYIAKCIFEDNDSDVSGAVDRADSPFTGVPIYEAAGCSKGGVLITSDIDVALKASDIVVDFTGAKATMSNLPHYIKAGLPVVIGSTGFDEADKQALEAASQKIPLLVSPNMSIGVNVALKLIELAAKSLSGYDIEVVETHHRMKKDAPSGTAIAIGEAAARGAKLDMQKNAVYCRHGIIGERKDGEIGIQSLRGGDVVGDHTAYFFGNGERIEITHRAHTRETLAGGALKAVKWFNEHNKIGRIYGMNDVLGL